MIGLYFWKFSWSISTQLDLNWYFFFVFVFFAGAPELLQRAWSHMVCIIQPLCRLCSQAGHRPPAAQKASSHHFLLPPLRVGAARDQGRPQGAGAGWVQAANDEASWFPACLGNVRGQGGRGIHTVGRLQGELWVLSGETGWYSQLVVSSWMLNMKLTGFYLLVWIKIVFLCGFFSRFLLNELQTGLLLNTSFCWDLMVKTDITLKELLWQHFILFIFLNSHIKAQYL